MVDFPRKPNLHWKQTRAIVWHRFLLVATLHFQVCTSTRQWAPRFEPSRGAPARIWRRKVNPKIVSNVLQCSLKNDVREAPPLPAQMQARISAWRASLAASPLTLFTALLTWRLAIGLALTEKTYFVPDEYFQTRDVATLLRAAYFENQNSSFAALVQHSNAIQTINTRIYKHLTWEWQPENGTIELKNNFNYYNILFVFFFITFFFSLTSSEKHILSFSICFATISIAFHANHIPASI